MSAPTSRQLADLVTDVEMTLTVLVQAVDHLRAALAVLRFHDGTDEPQHVTLRTKH